MTDIFSYASDITRPKHVAPSHEWITKNHEWKTLIQTYLACVSFVDSQIGRLITAFDNGAYGDHTYIVQYNDHGFHLGEKERYAKRSLWEDGAKIPLIVVGPGVSKGKVYSKPVQLLDIYPT